MTEIGRMPSSCCFAWLTLCICLPCLAETFTASLEGGLIYFAVAFDDINGLSISIVVGGDLHGASIPFHCSRATGECFDEDHGLVWGHPETLDESFDVERLASHFITAFPFLCRVVA